VGFFSARGLAVLRSELRWILLPSAIIVLLARMRLGVRLKPETGGTRGRLKPDATGTIE
jgi:hypothetical protein